ncbi:hypothetical protein Cgig2_021164 [Carnegiea gigantea]|uniref:TLC domain-containing protein n=1 Tax=Carnegiea gigantea TaxID=171969 RepID=A0A9Q1KY47_9CARY|nr:hypothetical protein Cgig2_021164 [Carnegiea gigantea]
MAVSKQTVMAIKSYQSQAEMLVKNHLLADPVIPYTAISAGILACKLVYDLTHMLSTLYFKSYVGLNKVQSGISTVHAIFIAAMSLYFVYWSDLFADYQTDGFVTFRSSTLSTFTLGVSVGYFIADLAMILWLYPSLGGMELCAILASWVAIILQVVHHALAGVAVAYSMFSGEAQLYTYMILISEVTTPEINLRWFLDTAGLKRSNAYLINGIVIFFAWLVIQMHAFGFFLVFVVPSVLAALNLMWFGKIFKGVRKTLAKRQ